jgi:hypothetical protein
MFVKYGFDKDGLMPYVVFIHALTETPARLLGHDLLLDNVAPNRCGRNGLADEIDIAMCVGDAKIIYPKVREQLARFDHLVFPLTLHVRHARHDLHMAMTCYLTTSRPIAVG